MKGKIFIVSIVAIIVFCLMGVGLYFVVWATPLKYSLMRFGPKSEKRIIEKEFTLEEVEELNIYQYAGDVQIKEAENDNIKIVIYGEKEEDYSIQVNEKKVDIESNINNNDGMFCFDVKNDDIIIYMPKSYENDLNITINYGRCVIDNLPSANLCMKCDAGNVDIGNIKDVCLWCDCGNVEIENVLNFCDVNVKLGNIKIKSLWIKQNSMMRTDFGNIEILETADIDIDTKILMGSEDIKNKEEEAKAEENKEGQTQIEKVKENQTVNSENSESQEAPKEEEKTQKPNLRITCRCGNVTVK